MSEFELFQQALDIDDVASREQFLDSSCGQDAVMRRRIEALLESHEGEREFLSTPAVEQIASAADGEADTTRPPEHQSTQEDDSDAKTAFYVGPASRAESQETAEVVIPLGYLEPSSRPDSKGRLAHYEVLEVVGRGAFGTVLRAFDEKLHRIVAIKVMAPELASTSPARKRFLREAQASAAIRHEHVVNIYAVEEKPLPYLVMEYIPGLTLQQRLDETGPLDVATVLQLGRQIAEGLAAAHAQHLIHRDIKPGNILLETSVHDRVKITDFGLARAADDASLTQSGTIAGTPMYMAPEQVLGHKLDPRADLFSLGSVLYQMVSGRPPFRAASTLAVLKRVADETPRPIQEIIPETPQWLCDIITRLHAKNPDERFQSAQEVAGLLANCESQLKEHSELKDLSLIPRAKSPETAWWKRLSLAAVLSPVLAFGLYSLNRPAGPRTVTEVVTAGLTPSPNSPGSLPTTSETTQQAQRESDDWVQLFNGKDLAGWKFHPNHTGDWEVKDGVLRGGRRQSYLFSERGDYENFRLRAEVKINPGGDSGILFRAPLELGRGRMPMVFGIPGCYEAEIQENPTYQRPTGSIAVATDDAPPLSLTRIVDRSRTRPDEWFTLELLAENNKFITTINGVEVASCTDPLQRYRAGHLALQVWNRKTVVQFRKVEIRELPPSGSNPVPLVTRRYASDEWIDVIPLIAPQFDRWDNSFTGVNEWRSEGDGIATGYADAKPCKLLLPLDAAWSAYEVEIEFTRRSGPGGVNVNLPSSVGDCPLVFSPPNKPGVFLGSRENGVVINDAAKIAAGKRTTLRFEMRRKNGADYLAAWFDDAAVGTWTGDIASIAIKSDEGYPSARRLSLWIQGGGNEIVFHRIRVRALDGGTVETLRPVPSLSVSGFNPFTDADIQRIAALPAEQQIEEVRKELQRRNPGFDGTLTPIIKEGVVTELKLPSEEVDDIAPVRALKGLVSLNCSPTPAPGRKGKLADISPLRGLALTQLDLTSTRVTDIEVLRAMPLVSLTLDRTSVADLSPLTGKLLKSLHVGGTKVTSLSEVPVARTEVLHCYLTQVTSKAELERLGVRFLDLWGVPTTTAPERLRELRPPLSRVNGKPLDDFFKPTPSSGPGSP